MSYLAQSHMVQDPYLIARVAACAATLDVDDPPIWAARNIWAVAAADGWAAAYAAASVPVGDPAAFAPVAGADPAVITDAMILASVTEVLARTVPPEEA